MMLTTKTLQSKKKKVKRIMYYLVALCFRCKGLHELARWGLVLFVFHVLQLSTKEMKGALNHYALTLFFAFGILIPGNPHEVL